MKPARIVRLAAIKGFTLVETLLVMVVLGIAAVSIISLQGNIFSGQANNQTVQVGVQLMQECAEQILARRRSSTTGYGYSGVTTATCGINSITSNVPSSLGAPTVTLKDDTGSIVTTCATTICLVTISTAGLTPITLQLVNY